MGICTFMSCMSATNKFFLTMLVVCHCPFLTNVLGIIFSSTTIQKHILCLFTSQHLWDQIEVMLLAPIAAVGGDWAAKSLHGFHFLLNSLCNYSNTDKCTPQNTSACWNSCAIFYLYDNIWEQVQVQYWTLTVVREVFLIYLWRAEIKQIPSLGIYMVHISTADKAHNTCA